MQTGVQVNITLPPAEVEELDKLVTAQKEATKNPKYSRSLYIREALDKYLENPTLPQAIPRTNSFRGEFVGRRPVLLMLRMEHVIGIENVRKEYKTKQINVIRQAIIERALKEQGSWINLEKKVEVDPSLEDIWLRAPDIYKPLEMHRNILYQIADRNDVPWIQGKKTIQGYEKEYKFGDIIRALKLSEEDIKKVLEYSGKKQL